MEGELQRVVGQRLRELRSDRGLSQEGFAQAIGVHRTYMGAIERGERNLTLRSLERIAERLGVEVTVLVCPRSPASGRSGR